MRTLLLLFFALAMPEAQASPWDYRIHYQATTRMLEVEANLHSVESLTIDPSSLPFLGKLRMEKDVKSEILKGSEGNWPVDCKKPCRLRYTFDFAAAARRKDLERLHVFDAIHLHSPSLWLVRPARFADNPEVLLTFRSDATMVTGLFPGKNAGEYRSRARNLEDLPWTIFGPAETYQLKANGSVAELALIPASFKSPRERIQAWAQRGIDAMIAYYGKLPVPKILIVVVPRNRYAGPGTSYGDGGAVTINPLALDADEGDLKDDWVMTHELVHLAFPMVFRQHHWIEEGIATYVEPLARLRAGELTSESVVRDMILGLPKGLPKDGDRGLDHTPTWGRTYWGGALFCLLADIELREKSQGRIGLDTALRGIINAGGSLAEPWEFQKALQTADKATGFTVLQDLYAKMKDAPYPVDLDAIWKKLGVALHAGGRVTFDDKAPLASVRKGILSQN